MYLDVHGQPMVPVPLQLDLGASSVPRLAFDGIHLILLLVVGYFGYRAFARGADRFGWAFALFVLAEISYIGYHVGVTTFLLSHTISEVLVFLAFALVFFGLRDVRRLGSVAGSDRPADEPT